jgi:hypothetical protein
VLINHPFTPGFSDVALYKRLVVALCGFENRLVLLEEFFKVLPSFAYSIDLRAKDFADERFVVILSDFHCGGIFMHRCAFPLVIGPILARLTFVVSVVIERLECLGLVLIRLQFVAAIYSCLWEDGIADPNLAKLSVWSTRGGVSA